MVGTPINHNSDTLPKQWLSVITFSQNNESLCLNNNKTFLSLRYKIKVYCFCFNNIYEDSKAHIVSSNI